MADETKDMVDKNSNQQLASTTVVMTHVIFEQNVSEQNTSTAPNVYDTLELPRLSEVEVVKSAVLSVIFLVSLVSNLAILVQLYRKRRRKSTVNLLILHLAIADLFVTFFCAVTEAIWLATIQWYAGNFMCKLVKFLQVFALYLSTYIIVIISIDRCMAILDPLRHNQAARRVRAMIVAAWVASCILSLPQAYLFRVLRGPFEEDFYQCVTYGAYTEKWQERLYGSLAVLTMYVLPLLAMTTSYLLIIVTIARKSNRLKKDTDSDGLESMTRGQVRGKLFRRAKVKSVRMTALIVLAFIVCWTPYDIILIIHLISDIETVEERYITWIFFFGMTNSMVNPLIYGAFNFSGARKNLQSPTQMRERARRAHTRATSSDNLLDTTTIVRSRVKNKCLTGEEIVMETLTVAYTEPNHRNNRDIVTPITTPPQPTIDILLSSSDQD